VVGEREMMSDPQIVQRLTTIVQSLSESRSPESDSRALDEEFEQWDSLHQMKVLVAIEEQFSVNFSPSEIVRPKNMEHLVRIVRQKLSTSQ
jgi:acyl carrier protein